MDDEQIVSGIVEWAKREGGKVPGQNRVVKEYGIGKPRLARLLATVDQRLAADRDQSGPGRTSSPIDRSGPDQQGSTPRSGDAGPTRSDGGDSPRSGSAAKAVRTDPGMGGPADKVPSGPDRGDTMSDRDGVDKPGPTADLNEDSRSGPVRTEVPDTRSGSEHSQDRTRPQESPVRSDAAPSPVRFSWRSGLVWTVAAAVLGLLGYRLADSAIGRGFLGWLGALGPHRLIVIGGVSTAAAVAATAVAIGRRQIRRGGRWSTRVFLAGACIGVVVSGDTSWRFFQTRAHINSVWERLAIFSGVEVVLVACGIAMYERAKEGHSPGNARWLAWALSGVSGYAALMLDGFPAGPFRVAAGPVLAVVALHMAMGIEIRHSGAKRRSEVLGKVLGELRERCLSRLGLGDDSRDARTRTRHRAAVRAARLAVRERALFKAVRLRRALVKAGVADDQEMRWVVERTLAVLKHAEALEDQRWESPWTPVITDERGGSMSMALAIVEAVGSCGRTKRTLRKESESEGHEG